MGASSFSTIRFSVEEGGLGTLDIDNLRLYDNPEVFNLEKDFNGADKGSRPEDGWTYSDKGSAGVAPVPFAEDQRLAFTTVSADKAAEGIRRFSSISGKLTVDAKVKANSTGWVTAPAVIDEKERVAAKVAMCRNSFFISNGDNWAYICNQELPHNYYPAGNWYQVKLVLDTKANRYDFYIDGSKRYGGAAFTADIDAVNGLQFAANDPNALYVDNIKVYDSDSLARGLMPENEVYNVKDFGAKGDGVTDDTEAIRQAVEAAAYRGGTVVLENGVFYTGQIILYNDMTFFLDVSATILADMNRNVCFVVQSKFLRSPRWAERKSI